MQSVRALAAAMGRPLAAVSMLVVLAVAQAPAVARQISISCGAVGRELRFCTEAAQEWAKQRGVEVRIVSTPSSTSERLALYQQLLAAGADDIDVFQVDVIWPGILGAHFIDLAPFAKGAQAEHFATIVENNTVGGRLVAMPWFVDAGVLYYRRDLLERHGIEPPTTWQELTATATKVMQAERRAGNDRMWGFVWQGRAYEGLTCNALEWIDSSGGGTIVDGMGRITIDNPKAAQVLALAASWVGTISPEGVLNYSEEEARGVFQSGNAVFMRNWPYAWSLANSDDSPVKGRVGIVPLPSGDPGGRRTGALGGWQLAVSRYSRQPALAADLVLHLTSRAEQKRRAILGSYTPTIPALYQDPEVLRAAPFFGSLYETFSQAVARPSRVTGASYNKVSTASWQAFHSVLSGQATASAALAALERDLKRIRRSGWRR